MKRQTLTFLAVAGAMLISAGTGAAQGNAPVSPRPSAQQPNDEGAAPKPAGKLVAPVRGQAEIQYTAPQVKRDGNMVVTTMKVKNVSSAPIAGFKVDEFWYDKSGAPVTGAPTFRARRPLQPGEIIEVVLRVPSHPQMNTNSYKFEHANGTIKPTRVPKL